MIDIRIPIGLLFSILGGLLLCYGAITMNAQPLYEKSLGIDVNLWAGAWMLLFGLAMLGLAQKVNGRK
jgi:hypothetical protein